MHVTIVLSQTFRSHIQYVPICSCLQEGNNEMQGSLPIFKRGGLAINIYIIITD